MNKGLKALAYTGAVLAMFNLAGDIKLPTSETVSLKFPSKTLLYRNGKHGSKNSQNLFYKKTEGWDCSDLFVDKEQVELVHPAIKTVNYEDLETKLLSQTSDYCTGMDYDYCFALFKLISEEPEKAVSMLKEVAEYQKQSSVDKHYRLAKNPETKQVEQAREEILKKFSENYGFPLLTENDYVNLYVFVKHDGKSSLMPFKTIYENVLKKDGKEKFLEEDVSKIEAIIKALETGDFSDKGKKIEIKFIPVNKLI